MSKGLDTYGTYVRNQTEKNQKNARRERIKQAVKQGNKHLVSNEFESLAAVCDILADMLYVSEGSLDKYGTEVPAEGEFWDWDAVSSFVVSPEYYVEHCTDGGYQEGRHRKDHPANIVRRTFRSLEGAAIVEGQIPSDLAGESRILGHTLQVGTMKQPKQYETPDQIRIVDPASHPPVSVTQGLPGWGKSTSIATEVEDRYAAGNKIIDLIDLTELENGLYDVPQQQEDLREARRDMGLAEDFLESDEYDRPDLEILFPVTPKAEGEEIPYNVDDDEYVAQPFSIPAADLPRKALNMMLSHTTDVQTTFLERAYQQVDGENDDWSLIDLAEGVLETEAQEDVKRNVYNTLATLQNVGFIRTRECEYAIEWEDIFRDTDTITAFTCDLMEDTANKFMVLAYLINSLYHERERLKRLPAVTAVFRELHHVAPNSRTEKEDEKESQIQKAMIDAFQELGSMHRHEDIEVLADTQQVTGQIQKRARAHVERVVTFRSQVGTLKKLFRELIGLDSDRANHMYTIASDFSVGQCAVIGKSGSDRPFEMPITFAPPMCHHIDAQEGEDGWDVRVETLQGVDELPDEELREIPWDMALPEELQFGQIEGDESPTPTHAFINDCMEESEGTTLIADDLNKAMRSYFAEFGTDPPAMNVFGQKLSESLEYDKEIKRVEGRQQTVYTGIDLTTAGWKHNNNCE